MSSQRHIPGLRIAAACSVALPLCLWLIVLGCWSEGADSTPAEIKETFSGRDFDHTRWTLSNTSVAITKVDFSRGVMRLMIPPGPDMRPLMGLSSRFGLEGDFDVRVDYAIRSLPKPEKEWVNLSIFISGPDGMAAISRTNDAGSGQGYSRWFQPRAGSNLAPQAMNVPTEDSAGTLRLERVGKELRFHAGGRGGPLHQIGAVEFGDRPIETVAFQVLPQPLRSSIDIEFDNIAVKADRIAGLVFVSPSGYGMLPWIFLGVGVAALVSLLWWLARRGR